MANISGNWNKNMPSGTSLISEGDDLMRQHWGSLQSGIQDEHFFNDSLTSAGIHRQGTARIFAGPVSAISAMPASTDSGRLYLEYDTGNLMHIGGAVTRANYGGGVCLSNTNNGNLVLGDATYKDEGVFSTIEQEWGPASADTWTVLSDSSCRRVDVPSNLSGYFSINYNVQLEAGVRIDSAGADNLYINVMKNSNSVYTANIGAPASVNTLLAFGLNFVLGAKAGDTIAVRAWHDESLADLNQAGTQQLSIIKVG